MTESGQSAAAYALEELAARLAGSGERWLEFIEHPTMRVGIYVLPAGAVDPQQPHDEDEIYYVVRGRAVLRVAGEDHRAEPGAILFVPAHVEHRFVDITAALQTLVVFSRAPASA